MIRSKTEILESIRNILGDNTSDDALTLLEDAEDTLTDFETKAAPDPDAVDWESRYRENDAAWRQRYKDRFFSDVVDTPAGNEVYDVPEEEKPGPTRFEDLFE